MKFVAYIILGYAGGVYLLWDAWHHRHKKYNNINKNIRDKILEFYKSDVNIYSNIDKYFRSLENTEEYLNTFKGCMKYGLGYLFVFLFFSAGLFIIMSYWIIDFNNPITVFFRHYEIAGFIICFIVCGDTTFFFFSRISGLYHLKRCSKHIEHFLLLEDKKQSQ